MDSGGWRVDVSLDEHSHMSPAVSDRTSLATSSDRLDAAVRSRRRVSRPGTERLSANALDVEPTHLQMLPSCVYTAAANCEQRQRNALQSGHE